MIAENLESCCILGGHRPPLQYKAVGVESLMSACVLTMRHIRKTFPGLVALDGVDFELRKGEVHVLLGENGAGKSTLVKILGGAYKKDGGQIILDDREVEIRNPRHAQQSGIACIHQEFNLIPHLSVGENIFLGREPMRLGAVIDQSAIFREAERALRDLGVEIDVRKPVQELSVAQQQIVEVVKALSMDARILIMDEPTSALTEHEIQSLFATIRKLKKKDVSIIYISHRLNELFEIGDRVTVLRDGKYAGTRDVAGISKQELITMMVDRPLGEHFPKQTMSPGEEVLRVEGLSKKGLLHDIRFSVYRGEIVGIAGLMGSGRTTLARMIFGLEKPDIGKIYVKGRLCEIRSPRAAIASGIGFLTEDRKNEGLVLGLSVMANMCLPSIEKISRFGIVSNAEENVLSGKFVQDLHIKTPALSQKVVYLSGGNQQKVVLSKWLCRQADIFIFDEPTRGIDVGAKEEIYQLMNRLTASGVAIIMISSELPEVLGMSDRILVMHQGEVSGEFPAREATQEQILRCALGE
jgi:ribose transport system ATP-binding protein